MEDHATMEYFINSETVNGDRSSKDTLNSVHVSFGRASLIRHFVDDSPHLPVLFIFKFDGMV
jgi:hypothetical protein